MNTQLKLDRIGTSIDNTVIEEMARDYLLTFSQMKRMIRYNQSLDTEYRTKKAAAYKHIGTNLKLMGDTDDVQDDL